MMHQPIFMYHYIGKTDDSAEIPYWVSGDEFEKQLEFLKKRQFQTINLTQLVDYIYEGKQIPSRSVVLTFDDGHISFYRLAYPILRKYGYKATMFLITSWVGKKGYMDWDQIIEMQENGFSFESHSITHAIITKVDSKKAKKEIALSKQILEEKLDKPIQFFAYRGGHYNEQAKQFVEKANYRAAVCSRYGYNDKNSDRFALHRIPVRGTDTLASFSAKLYGLNPQNKFSRITAQYLVR